MQVGTLIKSKHLSIHAGWIGVIIEINKRDLSFYKSHTYLVQFSNGATQWWQDYEMEVLCK